MALTSIPSGFGSGGAGLYPAGTSGSPSLEAILGEHKTSLESVVKLLSLRIQHGDLTDTDNGDSQTFNIGTGVLPTGAWIIGHQINVATAFSGGGATDVTVAIGGTDADGIVAATSVFTGVSGKISGTSGASPFGVYGGEQLTATVDIDAGHNLAGLTAGDMTISILYAVPQ